MRLIHATRGDEELLVLTEEDEEDAPAADFLPKGFTLESDTEIETASGDWLPATLPEGDTFYKRS